jgi:hypothetical protein
LQAFNLAATAPIVIIAIPSAAVPTYLTLLGDSKVAEASGSKYVR